MIGADGAAGEKRTLADRWRSFRAALRNLPRAFALVWQTSPALTSTLAVLTMLSAALPASQAWVAKLIVDAVVAALNADTPVADGDGDGRTTSLRGVNTRPTPPAAAPRSG